MGNAWKLPLSILATPPICDKCKLFHKVMARPKESRKANGFEDDRRESWYRPRQSFPPTYYKTL